MPIISCAPSQTLAPAIICPLHKAGTAELTVPLGLGSTHLSAGRGRQPAAAGCARGRGGRGQRRRGAPSAYDCAPARGPGQAGGITEGCLGRAGQGTRACKGEWGEREQEGVGVGMVDLDKVRAFAGGGGESKRVGEGKAGQGARVCEGKVRGEGEREREQGW